MTEQDHERMRDYLDGEISPANLDELNRLLENDTEARARFRALATMEEGLRDLAEVPAMSRPHPIGWVNRQGSFIEPTLSDRKTGTVISVFFSRPVYAAAAGLVIGVFCTSAIWAASESGRQKILTLIHESFESGAAPEVTGIPMKPEVWSGDYTQVVTKQDGLSPQDGDHMLRLLRADHEGKENPVGYVGDLYRVIDLHGHESILANDDAIASVESAFGSVPFDEPGRFVCGVAIYALSRLPSGTDEWKRLLETQNNLNEKTLATVHRWIPLSHTGTQWQTGRAELRLPMESRFLVIAIHVCDHSAVPPLGEPPAVEFSGQFLDDVRVVLSRRSSEF
jgi:hypothetical protein